jgi:hypothetical protein
VKRSFIHLKEAWYSGANLNNRTDNLVDDVTMQYHDDKGEVISTFTVGWYDLGNGKGPYAKLEIYDDAWKAIKWFDDVFWSMFCHGLVQDSITAEQFCALLLECGLVDETPTEDPYQQHRKVRVSKTRII